MNYFPTFVKLKDRPVLVIGGGEVACRKVEMLLRAGANITLVSPELYPQLVILQQQGAFQYIEANYHKSQLGHYIQVWVTTDNPDLNHQVYQDAKVLNLQVNVVDDPDYCDFITPAVIDRSPVQVAISSGGTAPVLIRMIREKIEGQLPQNLGLLSQFATTKREIVKQNFTTVKLRRIFWEHFFRQPELEGVTDNSTLDRVFNQVLMKLIEDKKGIEQGQLYIISVPDDPELFTIKAVRLMQQSEFLFHPQETKVAAIDFVRRDADKMVYNKQIPYSEINQELKQGGRVCLFIASESDKIDVDSIAIKTKQIVEL
ncbi:siroheme synthase [Vibrio sp. SS-MA-C1-2]|uniref:siroheme synthase n=1 Tax=Vibrio sp. SS-MA-C1-2 TaxID=2908646 RepID=UPI001F367EA6|nr:siroheme synthase [Vibrio sp. SS-MA-C1-2]UJF17112.1 siroheme synthase [Vibrio sp. SS-MA-C1-2]